MPNRFLTRALPWLLALLTATSWTAAQTEPRPLTELAPAESFLILGFNEPFEAPATRLQADLDALDFPRAGRTLQKLSELSSDPTLRDLLDEYGSIFQGLEGQLERQQRRMGEGSGFERAWRPTPRKTSRP